MYVQKKAVRIQAWQLGAHTEKEAELIKSGKIKLREDGTYELFSLEATGEKGEIAMPGDYFKLSSSGFPYPNAKDFFESKHEQLHDTWYLQKSQPLLAWAVGEPETDAIRFLLDQNLLQIHPDDPGHYFSAFLWGTRETSAQDSVIVFYKIERNDRGEITGVDFNFVVRSEFEQSYTILQ